MKLSFLRIPILIIATFIALTTMGGGIAMLTGVDQFPLEWLEGTPFRDYTIPALILIVVVGGSSLLALWAVGTGQKFGALAAIAAGVIMTGHIVVEVSILAQDPPSPTRIEVAYALLGFFLFGLGCLLWSWEHRRKGLDSRT